MTQLAWMLHEYIAEITLAVMLLLLLFMGILLQKINAVKKRLAKVTEQVEEYLSVILEDAANGQEETDPAVGQDVEAAAAGRPVTETAVSRATAEATAGQAAAEMAGGQAVRTGQKNASGRNTDGKDPRRKEQEAQNQLISAVLEEIFP